MALGRGNWFASPLLGSWLPHEEGLGKMEFLPDNAPQNILMDKVSCFFFSYFFPRADGKQDSVGIFRTAHGDQRTEEWHEGVRVCWVEETPPSSLQGK